MSSSSPASGGEPERLTHHPMADRVDRLDAGRQARAVRVEPRERTAALQPVLHRVGLDGGLPEKLPVPYGEFGTYSPDGKQFVYMPMSQDFRNWKRYRGGWAPDLMLFDLKTFATKNITSNPANDAQPMWHGNTIYFISDRGANERNNIWAYDVARAAFARSPQFNDFDITFPSIGPDGIVFQAGGRLYCSISPPRSGPKCRSMWSPTKRRCARRTAKVDALIRRGLGVANRQARGVRSTRRRLDGAGRVRRGRQRHAFVGRRRTISALVAGRQDDRLLERSQRRVRADAAAGGRIRRREEGRPRSAPASAIRRNGRPTARSSPSSIRRCASGSTTRDGELTRRKSIRAPSGSRTTALESVSHPVVARLALADLRAADRTRPTRRSSCTTPRPASCTQATTGYLNDTQPTFDPEGKYLFYASDREFDPVYGSFDNSWTYPNPTQIVAVPLRKDVKSPLAARNDAENAALDTNAKKDDSDKPDDKKPEDKKPEEKKPDDKKADDSKTRGQTAGQTGRRKEDGRSRPRPGQRRHRSRRLRSARGRAAAEGGQLRRPAVGQGQAALSPAAAHRLERREEPDRLLRSRGARREDGARRCGRLRGDVRRQEDARAQQGQVRGPRRQGEPEVREADGDRATWRCRSIRAPNGGRCSRDVYRFERDFFYDPNMHGVELGRRCSERYSKLLDDAVTRWDVNFVIGEFIGELNASHTYHGGGDMEQAPKRSVGMLGVDWELAERRLPDQADRPRRAVGRGGALAARRTRRQRQGGEYVLAVNGVPLDTKARSVGELPGPRRQDGRAHGQFVARRRPSARQVVVKCLTTRPSCGSAPGSRSAGRSSTRRPTAGSATSTCRAPASTRRTS